MNIFHPADILIPKTDMEKWAVIACDQFTSQPEYWGRVKKNAKGYASAINLILPESELSDCHDERIAKINETMCRYYEEGVFEEYKDAYVYVERTLLDGSVRCGIVGVIDLEEYDYSQESKAKIRATEKTVVERIPPRMAVRKNASIELPHVVLLCDDENKRLIESLAGFKNKMKKLYEFELMEGGGHIAGWLLSQELVREFNDALKMYETSLKEKYKNIELAPMFFAVGDGNHSLATAKACYENAKKEEQNLSRKRYALVELENIHADALKFEPIHRIVMDTDVKNLLETLEKQAGAESGHRIEWYCGEKQGSLFLDKNRHQLAVGALQEFLDSYLEKNEGEVDYIHGEDVAIQLAKEEKSIGFVLPAIDKDVLFRSVMLDGVLPRKTFSMGHAVEKRYYLEARKIREL